MDRNNYYGGESASLSLTQLYERFRPGQAPPKELGPNRDWNVDLVPKFMMANGKLVRVLLHTGVVKYLEFKAVDGSYVLSKGKIHKVPASDMEALKSPLMGLYVQEWDAKDPRTYKGYDVTRMTMAELYKQYDLNEDTTDFIGHSIALHRYEGLAAPYLYPRYGLGELPQAFARLSAVYGGTYMLSKPDAEVVYDESGKAVGVKSEGETAKAKFVVGDPSYFPERTKVVGKVVRAIAIMSHPIPDTNNAASAQIILPQKQIGRRSDMYVFCCSYAHNVAANGKWLAFVSTTVETANPEAELAPGLALLGPVEEKFVEVREVYEPLEDGSRDKAFISKGYDATTHFETTVEDVLSMYKRITGKC
ncbi:guanosine nucleotide diphosphate dissociation inhibitor, partial [Haematococcus lacustris]